MYEEVLKACKEWFDSIRTLYADKIVVKIDVDNTDAFRANMDTEKYISQLVVSKPECRPYNYVELTIMDICKEADEQPVFWYGDSVGDTVQEIIENLNKGLKILL